MVTRGDSTDSITYCSSVWGGASKSRLHRLQRTIHFAVRLVSGLRKFDHITPALGALGWPGIGEVIARRANDTTHIPAKDIDFSRLAPATRARLKGSAQLDTSDVNEVVDLVFTTFVAKRSSL
ncbi:hypothetical protein FJT64_006349 [Amphibalanus amphitrite]|uniref:Uncharacterized protein n=1 Tax=Amphibalanus amphitrite TaxID=1232801 RepID=A0A6A4VTB8_AMPAM|nr:hypothetical protein FJT64_006349 [Amphibalanus amphitrite]